MVQGVQRKLRGGIDQRNDVRTFHTEGCESTDCEGPIKMKKNYPKAHPHRCQNTRDKEKILKVLEVGRTDYIQTIRNQNGSDISVATL